MAKFVRRAVVAALIAGCGLVGVGSSAEAAPAPAPEAVAVAPTVTLPDGTTWTPTAADPVRKGIGGDVGTAAWLGCSSGIVCMFEFPNANQGYTGGRWLYATYPNGYSNLGWFNDRMQSWANNSGARYCWYLDDLFRGQSFIMNNYGATRIVNLTSGERNRASSMRRC